MHATTRTSPPNGRHTGFSLTELLVVIGIIVLLVGLLLVALGQVQKKARRTETLALLEQFANACQTFQAEHGRFPGVIPDNVLLATPAGQKTISGTENALLELMGAFRARGPNDPTDPSSPFMVDYRNFTKQCPAPLQDIKFGSGINEWRLSIDPRKIGEGPVINGKHYAPYFTPRAGQLRVTTGQVDDFSNDRDRLPDLIDAWGQPIIYVRRVRDSGPLRPDVTATQVTSQFVLAGVDPYLQSTELGDLANNQSKSILRITDASVREALWAVILGHPAFYKPSPPLSNPLYGQARGAFALISAGPDGVYFSSTDGPGSDSDPPGPITAANAAQLITSVEGAPRIMDDFDDIRVYGGG